MNILITGGSGYVGSQLSKVLLENGHQVTATGYRRRFDAIRHDAYQYVSADTSLPGDWQEWAAGADAIVNLAGRTIFKRWTRRYKRLLMSSRIDTTKHIVDALPENASTILVSTSAVGYYGSRGDDIITEATPAGDDFLAEIGIAWEAAAASAETKGARVVIPRFGVVLGGGGGAMGKMLPAFRSGVGGPIGSGAQWFPWIHLSDLVQAIVWCIEKEEMRGPVNFCAPHPVRQKDFARRLGKQLGRPAIMPAPASMLRLMLGEFAGTLLASQRVVPERLEESGFSFQFPDIDTALENILAAG